MKEMISYTFQIPKQIIGKIRKLSGDRKSENLENSTQKAIIIELLEIGLKEVINEPLNNNEMQDNPKQIKLV